MALTTGVPTNAAASGALAFDPASGKLYGFGAAGWVVGSVRYRQRSLWWRFQYFLAINFGLDCNPVTEAEIRAGWPPIPRPLPPMPEPPKR